MAPTVDALVDALRQYRLLETAQLEKIPQPTETDPKALARELVRRGWLTVYQANQLLQGKGRDLAIGTYVLLERVGEGGMGQVFKARHQKLGRIVALKLIRQERLKSRDTVKRFQREVRAAAALSHPNIVRAYDADEIGKTQLLVMEYIEGATDLARLVKENGPLPLADACDYMRQAALGLQHAFERGMVHRDIKPHNLLLTADKKVVKILDMGLARLDQADSEESSTMTHEGAVMGTPDYLAPEQAVESHTVDIRADLYSLGCTLYFLLTGRAPFPGGTLVQKIYKHQLEEPTPIQQLRPEVPPGLVAVVRKLMAKRPVDRYQTPAEAAVALASALDPTSATSLPAPTGEATVAEPDQPVAAADTATESFSSPFAQMADTAEVVNAPRHPPIKEKRRHTLLIGIAGALGVMVLLTVLLIVLRQGTEPKETPKASKPPVAKKRVDKGSTGGAVNDAWLKKVYALAPEEQVKAVAAKLKDLNPDFDGKVTHAIDGVVTELAFLTDNIFDISPVQALPGLRTLACKGTPGKSYFSDLSPLRKMRLTSLTCSYTRVADLSPLTGMRLVHLDCSTTPVADLSPLKGMPLATLYCQGTNVASLAPLRGTKLTTLYCNNTKVSDLRPLQGAPLVNLYCHTTPVASLAGLEGAPLQRLLCYGTKIADLKPLGKAALIALNATGTSIADLTPLAGQKLADLRITGTKVADLSPLNGMPLGTLLCAGTGVADLAPLAGAKLTSLDCKDTKISELAPLKNMKLVSLNLAGTKVALLSVLKGMPITHVDLGKTLVSDLTPLKGMPLTALTCDGTPVADLSPLKGMSLTLLNCNQTKVADLSAVEGMKLTVLHCGESSVGDLTPLRGMKLTTLACNSTKVKDLSPLTGMPLTYLSCYNSAVADLTPLKGMKLTTLNCSATPIADLTPLTAMPLTSVYCANTRVVTLAPLKGMKLTTLDFAGTKIVDLAPLKGMKLTLLYCHGTGVADLTLVKEMNPATLFCDFNFYRDNGLLRSLKTLATINNKPVKQFWKEVEAAEASLQIWRKQVAALPAEQQTDAVAAKLKLLNKGFDGKVKGTLEKGAVAGLQLLSDGVTDLSPVRALPGLRALDCRGTPGKGRLADLWPLKDMKLADLNCSGTLVADLTPLKGMKLRSLDCAGTKVANLAPLAGMPLTILDCRQAPVSNLSPLKGLPLKELQCDFQPSRDAALLRSMKTLQKINGKTVKEFWKQVDDAKLKKV